MNRNRTIDLADARIVSADLRALRCAVWQRALKGDRIFLNDSAAASADELRDRLRTASYTSLRDRHSR